MFVVAAVGCSTWSVRSSYDAGAVSRPYRTFAWATPAVSAEGLELQGEVERQLLAKGMAPVAPEQQPDVMVSYDLVENRIAPAPGVQPGAFKALATTFGQMVGPWALSYGCVERTLVIRFHDVRTDRAFWMGSATQAVVDPTSPKELTTAADDILRRFPTQTVAAR